MREKEVERIMAELNDWSVEDLEDLVSNIENLLSAIKEDDE